MNPNLLIDKLCAKDQKTFKLIFDRYYGALVSYSFRYTFDRSTSEDLIQEVFIHLWEHAGEIKITKNLKGYLYSMARNKSLNYLKSLKITDHAGILDLQTTASDEVPAESLWEENEIQHQKVQKMLKSLPEKMMEIFKLRVLSGYSYKEIASEMDVSVNTVKTQLQRAKSKLEKTSFFLFFLFFFS